MKYLACVCAFVCLVLCSSSPAMAAACDPSKKVCVGLSCSQVGVTMMDYDQQNILACLKDSSGALVWKSSTKPNCRVCVAVVDHYTDISAWRCTPYGGGISSFSYDSDAYDPDGVRVSYDCQ